MVSTKLWQDFEVKFEFSNEPVELEGAKITYIWNVKSLIKILP